MPYEKLKFKYPLRIGYEEGNKVDVYDAENKVFKAEVQINAVRTEFTGPRNSQREDTDIPLKNPCLALPFSLPIFDIGYNYPDLYQDPLEGNFEVTKTNDMTIVRIKGRPEEYQYLSTEELGSNNGTYGLIPYGIEAEIIMQIAPKLSSDEVRRRLEGYAGKIYQPECIPIYFFATSKKYQGRLFFPLKVPSSKLDITSWTKNVEYYAAVSLGNKTTVAVPLYYLMLNDTHNL